MPDTSGNVENETQYDAPKDKDMSKERAATIANSSGSSRSNSSQGGKATARTS